MTVQTVLGIIMEPALIVLVASSAHVRKVLMGSDVKQVSYVELFITKVSTHR